MVLGLDKKKLEGVPFDQKLRFEFPKFWNGARNETGIFHQAGSIPLYSRLGIFPRV